MESKKINQLATELAPELSDLTIIGDPTTGISKKITLSQMASLFTGTVEEYANLASFPLVGAADTIYIALDTNIIYRWNTSTSAYVELSPNIVTSLVFNDANGFDGTISLVGSTATLTITTALTTGSVGFIGASGALLQDNANFFWDNSNKRLGINSNAPTTALDVFGSGIIGRVNGTSTNNAFLGFASAGTNKWSIGNVQSDHRFRIYNEATTSELVSVLQTGEFGIGIANPTTKLHIDGGASALIANLDANVSVAKSVSFRSDNSARINLEVSGTESGSNAGADLFIRRYSDAGALIDTAFYIKRSNGNILINTTTDSTSGFDKVLAISNDYLPSLELRKTGSIGGVKTWNIGINNTGGFFIYDATSVLDRFTISSTGAFLSTTNAFDIFTSSGIGSSSVSGLVRVVTAGTGSAIAVGQANSSRYSSIQANEYITYNDDMSFRTFGAFPLTLGTNNTTRLTISSTGAATFSNLVSAATEFRLNNNSFSRVATMDNGGSFGGGYNFNWNNVSPIHDSTGALSGYAYGSDGSVRFYSNASASANTSAPERMRIIPAGYTHITSSGSFTGTSSSAHAIISNFNNDNLIYLLQSNSSSPYGPVMIFTNASPNNTTNYFFACDDSTQRKAVIYSNGTFGSRTGSYGSILSDEKYKTEIVSANSQWEDIKKLRVVNFKFKDDIELQGENALRQIGFIAQEVEKVSPNLVFESYDKDSKESWKSVKTSIIEIKAIKALQEAMSRIEILEEKIKQLESK